jgi:hypothetical protein
MLDAALINPTNTTFTNLLNGFNDLRNAAQNQSEQTSPFLVLHDDETCQLSMWYPGVACSDNGGIWHNMTLTEMFSRFEAFQEESYIGGLGNVNDALICVP